jgi:hypothetical protein
MVHKKHHNGSAGSFDVRSLLVVIKEKPEGGKKFRTILWRGGAHFLVDFVEERGDSGI